MRTDRLAITETEHRANQRTPAHEHDFMCLHFVLQGTYEESTRERDYHVGPGEFLYKPAGLPHWNTFRSGRSMTLRLEMVPDDVPELGERLPHRPVMGRAPYLSNLAARVQREIADADTLSPLIAESTSIEILAELARGKTVRDTRRARGLAARCVGLLDERFAEPIGLAEVAHALNINRTHLARAFRNEFGCSVGEYVRQRRVAYVAQALAAGDPRGLSELAIAAGFADQSHLTRSFKKIHGVPPGQWRRPTRH